MGIFSAIVGGIGLVSSIAGASSKASANKAAKKANAEIAGLNRDIAFENARDVTLAGRELEIEQYAKINRAISSTRAGIAGAGLELEDGPGTTTQDLISDMRYMGMMDVQQIRRNIVLERKKFEGQAEDFEMRRKFGMASANAISPGFAGITAGINAGVSAYSAGLFDEVFN